MKSIVYVGIDVHKDSYTLVCLKPQLEGEDQIFGTLRIRSDYHQVLQYLEKMQKKLGGDVEFICAYEAGCIGYSLYHQLTGKGVKCFILAPTSLLKSKSIKIKTNSISTFAIWMTRKCKSLKKIELLHAVSMVWIKIRRL